MNRLHFLVLVGALVGASCLDAQGAIIGPTLNNTFTSIDGAGERINIDQSNPLVLGPGTYSASLFSFFAVATAPTTPFLAINSDGANLNPAGDINSYSIIAAGSTITATPVPVTNVVQTVPFGGGAGSIFTLTQPTKVFAGVASGTVDNTTTNAMGFIGGTSVDHHNPTPTQFTPTVGGSVTGITNVNLGRIYALNVDVTAVPEPGTLALLSAGIIGLLVVARRRRSA